MSNNILSTNPRFQHLRRRPRDLTEQVFDKLTAKTSLGLRPRGKQNATYWLCICECGNTCEVRADHLTGKRCKPDCGCGDVRRAATRAEKHKTHGSWGTPEYFAWAHIVQRCTNENDANWNNYGGRGITICVEWRYDFLAFLAHVGQRPSVDHSLDRKDNSKGYKPGNVHWATQTEQMRNTRSNRMLTFNGTTQCVTAWAEQLGVKVSTLATRKRRGWSDARTITTPIRTKQKVTGTTPNFKTVHRSSIANTATVGCDSATTENR